MGLKLLKITNLSGTVIAINTLPRKSLCAQKSTRNSRVTMEPIRVLKKFVNHIRNLSQKKRIMQMTGLGVRNDQTCICSNSEPC
jgi:hypothetical protein